VLIIYLKQKAKKPELPPGIRVHLKHSKTGVQKGCIIKPSMTYKEVVDEIKKRLGESADVKTIKTDHGDDVSNDDDISFIHENDSLEVSFAEETKS